MSDHQGSRLNRLVAWVRQDSDSYLGASKNRSLSLNLLVSLVVTLSVGVMFYAFYRVDTPPLMLAALMGSDQWLSIVATVKVALGLPALPSLLQQSFPSLIGGISAFLFAAIVCRYMATPAGVVFSVAFVSVLSLEISVGFFSWIDIIANIVGAVIALVLVRWLSPVSSQCAALQGQASQRNESHRVASNRAWRFSKLKASATVLAFSSVLTMATSLGFSNVSNECARFSEDGFCEEFKRNATPVYMSYADLRNAVTQEAARPPDRIGRLYLYEDFVLLNEVNEGLHLIDNTEPTAPVNLAFLRIPGNTEVAIRNDFLYADSYVDLLTFDISDPANIELIGREQDIFPFDPLQNIPQNISFADEELDRLLGVIVSYRLK